MAEDLVRDINRHAEVVLAGREALLKAANTQQLQQTSASENDRDVNGVSYHFLLQEAIGPENPNLS
jgi:hypothetical protein